MAPHRIHVAVLNTDVPCLSAYAQRGLYSSQFRVLLQAAAERLNKDPNTSLQNGPLSVHITAFDAVGGTLPPLECLRTSPASPTESAAPAPFSPIDAILITGSVCSSYDKYPWIAELSSYIQNVYENYPLVKLFGSCFGHQLLADALLSVPDPAAPHSAFHVEYAASGFEVGIHPITLQPSFTAYFPPLARAAAGKPFHIQLIHGDQVVPTPEAAAAAASSGIEAALPSPWINMGGSAVCPIQGLYNPGRVFSFQGHFEFDAWHNSELSKEFARRKNWSAENLNAYLEWINRSAVAGEDDSDDSKAAAEAVMLFFAGEDQLAKDVRQSGGLLTPPLE